MTNTNTNTNTTIAALQARVAELESAAKERRPVGARDDPLARQWSRVSG